MTNISTRPKYQRVLINLAVFASFVFAYLIYGFGLIATSEMWYVIMSFLMVGGFFYAIYEAITSFAYGIYIKYVPNVILKPNDFRYYARLLVIGRNIVLALVNIIFIFNPIAAVWGVKITHIIATILMVFFGLYFVREKIKYELHRYMVVSALLTLLYLLVFLFLGVLS